MNIRFNFDRMTPVEFLPYSHTVTDRILSIGDHSTAETCQLYEDTESELLEMFRSRGFRAFRDNKCIYVLRMPNDQLLYVGFYDWAMNIGLSYQTV